MAQDVSKLLLQIDASVELMKRNLAQGENHVAQFERSTNKRLSSMDKGFASMGKGVDSLNRRFGSLRSGLAALGVGFGLLQIKQVIGNSLDYASSLGEVSQQLGVTTRDLQVYRYIASQVGVEQATMDKSLQKLNKTLGEAALGLDAPRRALLALGFSLEEIKRGMSVGEAMPRIADGLSKIESSAKRAAVETQLFGRAGQQLDTLLAGGSAHIDELTRAAEELGLVLSDEQIQNADDTADKLAAVQMVLSAQIAGIVAENADAILSLATALAQAAAGVANFMAQDPEQAFGLMGALAGLSIGSRFGIIGAAAGAAGGYALGRHFAPETVQAQEGKVRRRQQELAEIQNRKAYPARDYDMRVATRALKDETAKLTQMRGATPIAAIAAAPTGDIGEFLDTSGGGGKPKGESAAQAAAKAERERKDKLRDEFRYSSDLLRAEMDILRAKKSLATDYVDQASLAVEILDLEQKQAYAALDHEVQMGELTEARAAQLKALYDQKDAVERQAVIAEEETKRQEERDRLDQLVYDLKVDLLDSEAALARTANERRKIELRLLDLAYTEERNRLRRMEAEAEAAGQWKKAQEARLQLSTLDRRQRQDEELARRGTMGPLESFLDGIPQSADEVNEALELIAANGLASLTDGITAAIMGAESLGEAFSNVAKQIIADLIRIGVQRAIIGPLANALFGVAGGAGGGPVDLLAGLGFRAWGGPVTGDKPYIVGERGPELFVPRVSGSVLSNHALRQGGGGGGSGQGSVHRLIVEASPELDVRIEQVSAQTVGTAAPFIVTAAKRETMREMRRPKL